MREPPKEEEVGPRDTTPGGADTTSAPFLTKTSRRSEHSGMARQCGDDAVPGLRRRRRASQRMMALACGCFDPWPHRRTEPPLSEHELDAWVAAAEHILAEGCMPLVPIEVRRALWRRPADRALALLLHDASGGAVA